MQNSRSDPFSRFPNRRQATVGLRFFTRQRMRVTPDASTHERWHCLDDLYELDGSRHVGKE